ncbi:MAG: gamma-glutamyl-gamma-aminobutyrate hydrolase family protein [Bacilli bacterium]|nr:gamma-glutamyl-gamma-aminobutyrate hydrolase family protein [Bacilli bacterium]
MKKTIIGVPLRSDKDELQRCHEYIFDSVRHAILKCGGFVMPISPVQDLNYFDVKYKDWPELTDEEKNDIDYSLSLIDGLFIPGGNKFSPYDRYVLERAIELKIPILGVCLGMQIMSCYKEDYYVTKIESNIEHRNMTDRYVHKVYIDKNSLLYKIVDKIELRVNSLHTYEASENPYFTSVAYSEDGVLEAIELPGDVFCMGLQWHPEKMVDYDEDAEKIMRYFIAECEKNKFKKSVDK